MGTVDERTTPERPSHQIEVSTVTASPRESASAPPTGPSSGTMKAARAVVVVGGAEVIGKVATFAVMVVAARELGERGFGSFALGLALALLLQEVVRWGFDMMLTRDGSRDPSTLEDLYADLVALRLTLVAGVLGTMTLTLLLLGRLDNGAGLVLLLMTVSSLLDSFSDAGRAVSAALGRQSSVALALVLQRVATAGVALAALLLGGGLVGLGIGFVAGSITGVVMVQVLVRRYGVTLQLHRRDWARIRQTVRGSLAFGVDGAVSTALFRLDTLLLGALAGTVAVGHYAAAYRLLETVMFVNWAVSKAVFPSMAAATDPWQIRRAFERGVTVYAFVFAPYACVLLVRGGDVMRLLFGEEFAGRGATTLAWLALAPLVFGIAFLMGYAMFALDRPQVVLKASLLALGVNIAGNLVLVPVFDEVGAAATTTGSYVVQALFLARPMSRLVGRPRLERVVLVPLVSAVPAVAVLMLGGPVVLSSVLASLAYLVVWLPLAARFDPELVQVLRRLVPRRGA